MPTTLRSVTPNTKSAVEQEPEGPGVLFALACLAVVLLAATAILTLPMAVDLVTLNLDASDMTWLMGP